MRLFLAFLACVCLTTAAHAQVRTIPAEAKKGEMRHVQDMIVSIDGKQQRLAPGAQIRDASNRILLPAHVPAGAKVRYVLDQEGFVRRVWILTPSEAASK